MASGRFLLDTNIVIALFSNDGNIHSKLLDATEVFVPNIVFGELLYGARKSGRVETNLQRIGELLAISTVVDCDAETAQNYAVIKNDLRLKGKPIPENEIWIAALAVQHNLILATRNSHFHEIEKLIIKNW